MEKEGSNNTALVVVFAIVVLLAVAAFFAYRQGYLQTDEKRVDINVQVPNQPPVAPIIVTPPAQPAAPIIVNPPPPAAPNNPAPSYP